MIRATIATLRRHPSRLFMSVVAVALGVAFITGTLILTGMLSGSLDRMRVGALPSVLVAEHDASAASDVNTAEVDAMVAGDLDAFADVEGVQVVHGMVSGPTMQVLDRSRRIISDYVSPSGLNWFEGIGAHGGPAMQLMSGRAPAASGEVVLDTRTFSASGLQVGESVILLLPRKTEITATVVGVARYGSGEATAPRAVWFTTAEAQRLFLNGRDGYTGAWITTEPGADPASVRHSLTQVLPGRMAAWTADRASTLSGSRMLSGLGAVDAFVVVFVVIAGVSAAFLIVNTFAVVVAGRARELALLRMVGASRPQISGAVVFEAVFTGSAGCALGVPAGIGLAIISTTLIPDLELGGAVGIVRQLNRAILPGIALGLLITILAAVRPARLAGRAEPVRVLAGRGGPGKERLGKIVVPGMLLALIGGGALTSAMILDLRYEILVIGGGALALLVGATVTSPVVGRPILDALGLTGRLIFGIVGKIAHLNIRRQPQRTATMASALIIGMFLVTTVAVLSASTTASLTHQVRESVPADFRVHHAHLQPLGSRLVERLGAIDGIAGVHAVQRGVAEWAGESRGVRAQSPQAFGKVHPQSLISGRMPITQNEVAMDWALAQRHGVQVDSRLDVTLSLQREPVTMTVTGLYAESEAAGLGPFITVPATFTGAGLPSEIRLIGIDLRDNADPTAVRAEIDQAMADSQLIQVLDRHRIVDERLDLIENLLNLVKAILVLSVLVAALGIINTLTLSISERVREIGLLRAVGLTRVQLRWGVGIEAVSVAVLGCAVGAALGLLVGAALQHGLASRGLTILEIPGRQLAAAMVGSVVLGVIAAAWPARLAARMDIVRAVSPQ